MPWHAKPDRCRRDAAARRRVPRLAHARTYVTRHIASGRDVMSRVCRAAYAGAYANRHYRPQSGRKAFHQARDVCRGIRGAVHSSRPHALRRNGSAPIPDTHSGRARKWRRGDPEPRHARQDNPHTRFRTHIFANNPRERCHEALYGGLPVVFRRHESGVSFSASLRKSGIITSEGRSWIQSSKSAGSNGAQARKGRCSAFEIIEYRKLNLVMIMCGTGSTAR